MSSGPKTKDLMNRLVPKQQIHNNPVTFNTSIYAGRSLSRSNRTISRSTKLPPLPDGATDSQNISGNLDDSPDSLTSPFKFIEHVRSTNNESDFVYLQPMDIEENEHNPTRLRIVPSSQIKKDDFYTLSLAGLSHVKNSVVDFIPLDDWLRSCDLFRKIMRIPFFKHHRQWKSFTSWKRSVARDFMVAAASSLKSHLFIVHPILRPAFFNIQREIQSLHQLKLFHLRADSLYTLDEFAVENDRHRESIAQTLAEFTAKVTEMVQVACEKTIDTLSSLTVTDGGSQHSPLDHLLSQYEKAAHRGTTAAFDSGPSLTFTQRAANRTLCGKLVKFIKLVDSCILSALRHVAFSSILELYAITSTLQEKVSPLPPLSLPSEFARMYPSIKAKASEFFESPILRVDISYGKPLEWTPNESRVIQTLESVRSQALSVLSSVPPLVQHPAFRQYISPDGADRSRQIRSPIQLLSVVEGDAAFQPLVIGQRSVISAAFQSLADHAKSYAPAVSIFEENLRFDAQALVAQGASASELSALVKKFTEQTETLARMEEKTDICLFCQFSREFRARILKSPADCLAQIRAALPLASRRLLSSFSADVRSARASLFAPVTDVATFVAHLTAAERLADELTDLQKRSDEVRDLYTLAQNLGSPAPAEEVAEFTALAPALEDVRQAVSQTLEQKPASLTRWSPALDKLVKALHSKILDVAQLSLDPSLSSVQTPPTEALKTLSAVSVKVRELEAAAAEYNQFQKAMSVPLTRYEDLEELSRTLSLKSLLWETRLKWASLAESLASRTFSSVDPTALADEIREYQTAAAKTSVGLPGNVAALDLKAAVGELVSLLPIVADLKNPSLTKKFQEQIATLLGFNLFNDDNVKFGRLFELRAFHYAEEIAAISAQASSEQALHDQLSNAAKMLDKLAFTISLAKGEKKLFIFGGFDALLTSLDEAAATVAAVRSSRFVAALRPVADEHARLIRVFSQTLESLASTQRRFIYANAVFSVGAIAAQLPSEAKEFYSVKQKWAVMSQKAHDDPAAFRFCTSSVVQSEIEAAAKVLEKIERSLADYLERKRSSFPRFYFLSDEDLLDLMAKSREPEAVQPHLRKIFEGIFKLEIVDQSAVAVISSEGEKLPIRPVKLQGAVEGWLAAVEEQCQRALKVSVKSAVSSYADSIREDWVTAQTAQIALAVAAVDWAEQVESRVEQGLQSVLEECDRNLRALARVVRLELPDLERTKLSALITADVHRRDVVSELIEHEVTSVDDFEWQKRLRYRYDDNNKDLTVEQAGTGFKYGYEYLGCSGRLVITPLTDRCYLTLTGALNLHLGGAPAGPAGTGKTETVKDLAKALAIFCIVFNCSESVTVRQMSSLFRGLAQAGAWSCFDEFNRINIEVLSVIGEQFNSIRLALSSELRRFDFEGTEIPLSPRVGCFITMNPGYAGRTELPDNLKALFRPISMMVPDYSLIAEVMLFGEGFAEAKRLSTKMTRLYKLSSEMLSQQDHYDFGMRALKSVLVMAGSLRRANSDISEDETLIRAMRDANLAKFVKDDVPLFDAIVADLFPNQSLNDSPDTDLRERAVEACATLDIIPCEFTLNKVQQLRDSLLYRHGVMLVGPAGGGKTTVADIVAITEGNPGRRVLNPKSLSLAELYGEADPDTQEWRDGLIATMFTQAVEAGGDEWVVFDGPVDALWIENMNTVLDDNKLLSLANSTRIKLTKGMRLLFEVEDLAVASPATVSRCAMVYVDSAGLTHKPLFEKNCRRLNLDENTAKILGQAVDAAVDFLHDRRDKGNKVVILGLIACLFDLLSSILPPPPVEGEATEEAAVPRNKVILMCVVFAFVWSMGGHLDQEGRLSLDTLARDAFGPFISLPPRGMLLDYYIHNGEWKLWSESLPEYTAESIIVPTVDTERTSYVLSHLTKAGRGAFLRGTSGCGKTVVINRVLRSLEAEDVFTATVSLSATTTSPYIQEMIESKLERKRGIALQPPGNRPGVFFIDDLNVPEPDYYRSQPPLELIRLLLSRGGLFERPTLNWSDVRGVTFIGAGCPDGGSRVPPPSRLLRYLMPMELPSPDANSLEKIFTSLLNPSFEGFSDAVKQTVPKVVRAAVDVYLSASSAFLPTPDKCHYVFNLRDLSSVTSGLARGNPQTVQSAIDLQRLFSHEAMRAFGDRLVTSGERRALSELITTAARRRINADDATPPDHFTSLGQLGYEEVTAEKALRLLNEKLAEYSAVRRMDPLVLYEDAVGHVLRISRILNLPRGHSLIVGVAGTGKRTLARFATFVADCELFEPDVRSDKFKEELSSVYLRAGVAGKRVTLLIGDAENAPSDVIEMLNGVLNTGEVPKLLAPDELDKVCSELAPAAKTAGISESRDALLRFFIERVRSNLHVILTMSPAGSAFRSRIRQFPSLATCCSVDWVDAWPDEALQAVAMSRLPQSLAKASVRIHKSVEDAANRLWLTSRRKFYVTPALFIKFVTFYRRLQSERENHFNKSRSRLASGVSRLEAANALVARMKETLSELEPILAQKADQVEKLVAQISQDEIATNALKEELAAEEKIVQTQAADAETLAREAQRELDEVLPMLEEATASLKSLSRGAVAEVRQYADPHVAVRTVMEAICLLAEVDTTWKSAVSLVSDPMFISKISNKYSEGRHVPLSILNKLKPYVEGNPNFQPEEVGRVSLAAKQLCQWATVLYRFEITYRAVEPKQAAVAAAQQTLREARDKLREKQAELTEASEKLRSLRVQYEAALAERAKLQGEISDTNDRLERAARLTVGLADERERWTKILEVMDQSREFLEGDSLAAAAMIVYSGPFPAAYRKGLRDNIVDSLAQEEVKISEGFSLQSAVGDEATIRDWHAAGLPRDSSSVENALVAVRGPTPALLVDPQNQASTWLRSLGSLLIVKSGSPGIARTLDGAARAGTPVLVEDVGETLDPAVESFIPKKTAPLYLTTRLANPHFLPDLFVKLSVINFAVTPTALEAQLLSLVVSLERPELEQRKHSLVMSIAADRRTLLETEDKLLEILRSSGDKILDDDTLVDTVTSAKAKAKEVEERVAVSEATEIETNKLRLEFESLAVRASALFFVVADMATIDPMYEYSLEFMRDLIEGCIRDTAKGEDRIAALTAKITYTTYLTVSRGLFEVHRPIFAFSMCGAVLREKGELTNTEWDLLVRGGPRPENPEENPLKELVSQTRWDEFCALPSVRPSMGQVVDSVRQNYQEIADWIASDNDTLPSVLAGIGKWDSLLFVKCLAIDRLSLFVRSFVGENLGEEYTRSPPLDLHQSIKGTKPSVPLLFILSQGADPRVSLQRLATDLQMEGRLKTRSLGQGQGPEAERAIQTAATRGDWVFLQNCHLSISWLSELESIIARLAVPETHSEFRLFLSSMPTSEFPVGILRNSVKVTNEPPKGIRANLQRLLPQTLENRSRPYKRLLYSVAFFHSIIQERKKFGPLGFNKIYEWTETDFSVASIYLKNLTEDSLPWPALVYLTGEIIYGGRVTDEWDRRCMNSILSRFYNPEILKEGFRFNGVAEYGIPSGDEQVYINSLPFEDSIDVFGMHQNAQINFRRRESETLLKTLQSTGSASGLSGAANEAVLATVRDLMSRVPILYEESTMHESLLNLDPLSVVLRQEIERFRGLLKIVNDLLSELEKALCGMVAMSPSLEDAMHRIYLNRVPRDWEKYPSLKGLQSWFTDLSKRIDFMNEWMRGGNPISFWLSAFYFPQSFLTGILQRHSRQHGLPIDSLSIECEVLNREPDMAPSTGVYVHGLILDGARWNGASRSIDEQDRGQVYSEVPWVHLKPTDNNTQQSNSYYQCPVYITAQREGVLSTTGTSTNFVVALPLPTQKEPDHWILRGAAMLLGTPE